MYVVTSKLKILWVELRKHRWLERLSKKRIVGKFTTFSVFNKSVFYTDLTAVNVDYTVVAVCAVNVNIVSKQLEKHKISPFLYICNCTHITVL